MSHTLKTLEGWGEVRLKKCKVHLGDVNTDTFEPLSMSARTNMGQQRDQCICQRIQKELDPVVVNLLGDWQLWKPRTKFIPHPSSPPKPRGSTHGCQPNKV